MATNSQKVGQTEKKEHLIPPPRAFDRWFANLLEHGPAVPAPRRQRPGPAPRNLPVLEPQSDFGPLPRAPRRRVTGTFAPVEFEGVDQETGRRKFLWYIPGQAFSDNRDHTREMMQLLRQNVNISFFLRHTTTNVL